MSGTPQAGWMQRTGATPGKLALVGVLALVMAYVLISQLLPSKSGAERAPSRPPTARSVAAGGAAAPANAAAAKVVETKPWPAADLPLVVSYDPFAPPPWARAAGPPAAQQVSASQSAARAAGDGRRAALETLIASGAAVVVIVDGEPLAMVGDKQVRVGDHLEGFKVTAITESGIVLASEGELQ